MDIVLFLMHISINFCDSLDPNSTTEFEKLRELESILLKAKEKLFFKNLDFKGLNAD